MATKTKYTYSVADDTATGQVNAAALHVEIDTSVAVIIGVSSVEVTGDVLDIWMKDILPSEQEVALTVVVATHLGNAFLEDHVVTVEILEDRTRSTRGTFQGCMWEWTIPASVGWHKLDASMETSGDSIKYPFAISTLYASWAAKSEHAGDIGRFVAGDLTVVGETTSVTAVGATVLNVSSTVTKNTYESLVVTINGQDLGRIIGIDAAAGTITVDKEVTTEIAAGSYVQITKEIARRIYFEDGGGYRFDFGGNRVGGSLLPAGVECHLYYYNSDGASKKFRLYIEYVI